ncbi:MAG: GNAT family N-acetyltransferase, partial [Selenomonadaceae bacterium]|nr:GNAT family N-acetyltransferase [Selenomonadaceae bacterium]
MSIILIEDDRLALRRAEPIDVDYILELQADPENAPYIIAYDREFHQTIIDGDDPNKLSIIVDDKDGARVGYFLLEQSDELSIEMWHMIIGRGHKGQGIGHRALRLLKRWVFEVLKWHRMWIDCKDFNWRAIHLYSSEGFRQEALFKEAVRVGDEYQNLIIFAMLEREYQP